MYLINEDKFIPVDRVTPIKHRDWMVHRGTGLAPGMYRIVECTGSYQFYHDGTRVMEEYNSFYPPGAPKVEPYWYSGEPRVNPPVDYALVYGDNLDWWGKGDVLDKVFPPKFMKKWKKWKKWKKRNKED